MKTEEKKTQHATVQQLLRLNESMQDLISSSRELDADVNDKRRFVVDNLMSKLRSSLSAPIGANDNTSVF